MPGLPAEDLEKRQIEAHKLIFDLFKHLTTLSSGSVVLFAVLLDKAFPNPERKWLVGVAVVSFMVSVVCSTFMMFITATTTTREQVPDPNTWFGNVVGLAMLGSGLFFVLGILVVVYFVVLNA